jgi:hypothetical protein
MRSSAISKPCAGGTAMFFISVAHYVLFGQIYKENFVNMYRTDTGSCLLEQGTSGVRTTNAFLF